jgi:hypothetical protein
MCISIGSVCYLRSTNIDREQRGSDFLGNDIILNIDYLIHVCRMKHCYSLLLVHLRTMNLSEMIRMYSYCMSFLFNDHASAQNVMLLIYIMTGAVMTILVSILAIIPSTQSTGKTLRYIFRFIPNYAFAEIIRKYSSSLSYGSLLLLFD